MYSHIRLSFEHFNYFAELFVLLGQKPDSGSVLISVLVILRRQSFVAEDKAAESLQNVIYRTVLNLVNGSFVIRN